MIVRVTAGLLCEIGVARLQAHVVPSSSCTDLCKDADPKTSFAEWIGKNYKLLNLSKSTWEEGRDVIVDEK